MAYLGRGIENLSDRVVLDSLTASTTASYTLQLNSVNFVPSSAESLTVSLNGVIQAPISSYTVSGSTLTFASALTSSDSIDFIIAERGITLQTPSAGSVGTSQLASNAVDLTSKVTGTLPLANGGIGSTTLSGAGIANTPLVAVRSSTGQTISNNTDTKVQLDTEMIDTDNTFDSSTNYRWSPSVAGKYYITGTVSININSAGKYLQAKIYKNGSMISYQQGIAEGTNATYTVTVDVIDDNDGDDYYELYIRQNTGGNSSLNSNADALYTRFFGYKLIGD